MNHTWFEKDTFDNDIKNHVLTVLRDEGVYRHLRFRRPGTICMGFDIVTWPGLLCYSGDMGSYVFQRLEDMFDFFRTDGHGISYGYWAEKVVAADREGVRAFSPGLFKKTITEEFDEWLKTNVGDEGDEFEEEVRYRFERDVLSSADDGQVRAYDAAVGFEFHGEQVFPDFWENNCEELTGRFLWCCHAVAWGIGQYDKAKLVGVSREISDE